MRKYFKTNPEINVPSPLPTQAKQVCFETLNTVNIENTTLWVVFFQKKTSGDSYGMA